MLGTLAGIDEPQVRLKDFLGPNAKSMFNKIGCILGEVEVWVPYLLLQGVSMVVSLISTDRKRCAIYYLTYRAGVLRHKCGVQPKLVVFVQEK